MALISLEHVTKEYDGKPVVNDLSLKVDQGELFVLVGTSGSGKTTTLKMINRLVDPTSGVIEFADKPLTSYKMRDLRWDLGYVLQQIALFPTMTVAQNIAVIPEMKGWSRQKFGRQQTSYSQQLICRQPSIAIACQANYPEGSSNASVFCGP